MTFDTNFLTFPLTSSRDARYHLSSNGQNLAPHNIATSASKLMSIFSRGPDTRSREQSNGFDRLGSTVLPLLRFDSSPCLRCNYLAPLQDLTILKISQNLFIRFRPSVLPWLISEMKKSISPRDTFATSPTCDVSPRLQCHTCLR
jgi:hypothetical protein